MKNILVAGGAGFIGSHLVNRIDGDVFDLRTGQNACDFDLVKREVEGRDIVFHLANMPAHRLSFHDPHKIMQNNYLATLNFAEACRISDVKIIFASSFGVYSKQALPFREDAVLEPKTPYGVAKKSCEELLKVYHELYGMDIIIVRPSNVWGENDYLHEPLQVLPKWINSVKEGKEIIVYGEETTRDFTHISDFIEGIILASKQKGFEIFNLASGKDVNLAEIARSLTDSVTVKPLPEYEVEKWRGDITKARSLLGWEPKKQFWEEFKMYSKERLM